MNKSREIFIEKIVLNISSTGEKLEKGYKLIEIISKQKPMKVKVKRKRIPAWGVRPGLEVGVMATIRKNIAPLLQRLLASVDNKLKRKQIAINHFAFGIKEYIEIPGMEYQRDIGILGLDVIVVFARHGKRISTRARKYISLPRKQAVSRDEIIKYMEENFKTKFK